MPIFKTDQDNGYWKLVNTLNGWKWLNTFGVGYPAWQNDNIDTSDTRYFEATGFSQESIKFYDNWRCSGKKPFDDSNLQKADPHFYLVDPRELTAEEIQEVRKSGINDKSVWLEST